MTKQLRITSDLINSPLFKSAVGFDRLVNDMFDNAAFTTSGYPPYNVLRLSKDGTEDEYEITLAVAGFTLDDISITVEKNNLTIKGEQLQTLDELEKDVEYLHRGIAERNFTRSFRLAEHVEVQNATLKDGMLRVKLVRNVPEAVKPKRIAISAS